MGREVVSIERVARALAENHDALAARLVATLDGSPGGDGGREGSKPGADENGSRGAVRTVLLALLQGIVEHVGSTGSTELSLPYEDLAFLYWHVTQRTITKGSLQTMFSQRFKGPSAQAWGSVGLGSGLVAEGRVVAGGPGRHPDGEPGVRGLRIVVTSGGAEVKLASSLGDPRDHPFCRELEARKKDEKVRKYYEALEAAEKAAKAAGLPRDAEQHRRMRSNIRWYRSSPWIFVGVLLAALLITACVLIWRAYVKGRLHVDPNKQGQPPRAWPVATPGAVFMLNGSGYSGLLERYHLGGGLYRYDFTLLRFDRTLKDSNIQYYWFTNAGGRPEKFVTVEPTLLYEPRVADGEEWFVAVGPNEYVQATTYFGVKDTNRIVTRASEGGEPLNTPAPSVETTFDTELGPMKTRLSASTNPATGRPEIHAGVLVPPSPESLPVALTFGPDPRALPVVGAEVFGRKGGNHGRVVVVVPEALVEGGTIAVAYGDRTVDENVSRLGTDEVEALPPEYRSAAVFGAKHIFPCPGLYPIDAFVVHGAVRRRLARHFLQVP